MDPFTIATIVMFAVSLTLSIIAARQKGEGPTKYRLGDFDVPAADESTPVAILHGTRRIAPNCVWRGDFKRKARTRRNRNIFGFLAPVKWISPAYWFGELLAGRTQTLGYKYRLGMAWTFCRRADEFVQWHVDNELWFKGADHPDGEIPGVFDETHEGVEHDLKTGIPAGIMGSKHDTGRCRVYFGEQTAEDAYLASKTGPEVKSDASGTDVSDGFVLPDAKAWNSTYAGTCMIVMGTDGEPAFVGDDRNSVPRYMGTWARTLTLDWMTGAEASAWASGGWDWTEWAEINFETDSTRDDYRCRDANPALVLYSDLRIVCGVAYAEFDVASFKAAAETLFTEQIGVSPLLQTFGSMREYVDELKRHMGAVLFRARSTGLVTLKLIRDDYDPDDEESVPVLDESQMSDIDLRGSSWASCDTDVRATWLSRKSWKTTSATASSSIARGILGRTRVSNEDFPFFTHVNSVRATLGRLVRSRFQPVRTLRCRISDETVANLGIEPGSVVKVLMNGGAFAGTPIVFRVMSAGRDNAEDAADEYELVEDVFSRGDVEWHFLDGTIPDTGPITNIRSYSAGHVLVRDGLPDLASEGSVHVLAVRDEDAPANVLMDDFGVWIAATDIDEDLDDEDEPLGSGRLCRGWGELVAGYQPTSPVDEVGFLVDGATAENFAAVSNTDEEWGRLKTCLVLIHGTGDLEWEIVSVREIVAEGGDWRVRGVVRGIHGSTVMSPAIDPQIVYLLPDYGSRLPSFPVGQALRPSATPGVPDTLSLDVAPVNEFSRGGFTTVAHDYGFRPETPLSPQDPVAVAGSPGTVTWSARVRGQGATNLVEADLYPGFWEGVEPEGRFRVENTDTLVEVVTAFGVETASLVASAGHDVEVRCEVAGRLSAPATTVAV